jgi:RNA polymerase-binding transcription factor DksA
MIAKAERDANELTSMSLALDKIADGTYGVCEACGDDIGYPRLLAYPGARRCLGCQEKAEGLRHS